YWLPTIRGYAEIRRGNPAQAVKNLESAAPYDLAFPPPQFEEGDRKSTRLNSSHEWISYAVFCLKKKKKKKKNKKTTDNKHKNKRQQKQIQPKHKNSQQKVTHNDSERHTTNDKSPPQRYAEQHPA